MEWKLDGARVQVHRHGDDVRVYTRNLNDVTARLELVVAIARSLPATSFVLDGEVLGVDDDGRPRIFQDTMSRFGSDELGAAVGVASGVLRHLAPRRRGPARPAPPRSAGGARTGGAGVVHPGHRHRGPRGGRGDAAHLARHRARRRRRQGDGRALRGRTSGQLVAQGQAGAHARPRRAGRRVGPRAAHRSALQPPPGCPRSRRHVRDGRQDVQGDDRRAAALADRGPEGDRDRHRRLHRDGRAELVVEIALDGVQVSRRYPGGVALRFARVRGYRPDRSPVDADTIETVQAMLRNY